MATANYYPKVSRRESSEQLLVRPDGIASNRVSWIRQTDVFGNLRSADLAEVADTAKERNFSSRSAIFCEDDPAYFVFIIVSGRVKVTQSSREGKEVILRINGAGEIVDELGLVPGSTHKFTALAIESCHLLAWERQIFQSFTQRFPSLQSSVTNVLASRLYALQQRFCALATEHVPQRLARTLLSLTEHQAEFANGAKLIGLSCEELAQMTGTTVFTVSRLLTQWTECGIIHTERRSVLIENLSELSDLAEGKDS